MNPSPDQTPPGAQPYQVIIVTVRTRTVWVPDTRAPYPHPRFAGASMAHQPRFIEPARPMSGTWDADEIAPDALSLAADVASAELSLQGADLISGQDVEHHE